MPESTVFVSRSSFESEEAYDIVYSNVVFVNALFNALFEPDEIADDALTSYYVDFYVAQVRNGGFR